MTRRGIVSLVLRNGRLLRDDGARAPADAVAIAGTRVAAAGRYEDLMPLIGARTEIIDVRGAYIAPGFHDAHLHLLSWARMRSGIDCRATHQHDVYRRLADAAAHRPAGGWLVARGYDENLFAGGAHPDRHALDSVVPAHPVRLQHRGMHLDILNTRALQVLGLWETEHPAVERQDASRAPTGRLVNGRELLRARRPRPSDAEVAGDVRAASDLLLSRGVTSVQDASATNGGESWELLHRLAGRGALGVRTFMHVGDRRWNELDAGTPPSDVVRRGPVKLIVDEATGDFDAVAGAARAAHLAGHAVALHAVTEAELSVALAATRSLRIPSNSAPNRIEHAAVVPHAMLPELAANGLMVVGQPAFVAERGDHYRADFPREIHSWLHRARSFVSAGVGYAIGSDAPVTDPNPAVALWAACTRRTRQGRTLGATERLDWETALRAMTLAPARSVGADRDLGHLEAGACADVIAIDPQELSGCAEGPPNGSVRLTVAAGAVVWAAE